jgi:hypothetical protein
VPLDPSLTALELDVIHALSMSRVTASSVTLAADLWRTNDNWTAFDVEPLVSLVVRSLGEQGLVQYIERPGWTFPVDIRLSRDGWALAGYPNTHSEVGTPSRHRYSGQHPHDPTEYRNHGYHAKSSPIVKEDFPTHRFHYPHHIHDYGELTDMVMHPSLANPRNQIGPVEDPTEPGKRTYFRVTADIEAQVLAARERLGFPAYADIAEVTGVPERTVKYILTELPRLRKSRSGDGEPEGSLRERILVTLQHLGEVKTVAELQRIMGRADDKHNIVHVLHNLKAGGLVEFREAAGRDHPTDITLHKKGAKRKVKPEITDDRDRAQDAETLVADMDERDAQMPPFVAERIHESVVDATSVVSVADIPGMDDTSDDFPLLDELILREAKRQSGDETALAYIAAANAIEKIDPQMAADLMAKAKALDVPYPSPLEREYLRYAVKHDDVKRYETND